MRRLRNPVSLFGALALLAASTAASASPVRIALLGISGHDPANTAIASVAETSLRGALSARFQLVPGDQYMQVARALGASSPAPADVANVSAALKLGYLVAGMVSTKDSLHEIVVTVRRGSDGQVLSHFRYAVDGATLDDDTASRMDGDIVAAISSDAGGGTPEASARGEAVQTVQAEPAQAATGGDAAPADADASPSPADSRNSGDENPLAGSGGSNGEGVSSDSESPLSSGQDQPQEEVTGTAPSPRLTLGNRPTWRPLATAETGLTLLARRFTFNSAQAQSFNGNPAPALHFDGGVFPFAAGASAADQPWLAGLGIGGTLDYGLIYSTPFRAGASPSSLKTFQENYEIGARTRFPLTTGPRPIVLRAGLGYGVRVFAIQQQQGVMIPNLSVGLLAASAGLDVPLAALFKAFADVEALVPMSVSDDTTRFGQAAASPGVAVTAGATVSPKPWLQLTAAFDFITQGFTFPQLGAASEQYVGATFAAGLLY